MGGTLNGCILDYWAHLYEPSGGFVSMKRRHMVDTTPAARAEATAGCVGAQTGVPGPSPAVERRSLTVGPLECNGGEQRL